MTARAVRALWCALLLVRGVFATPAIAIVYSAGFTDAAILQSAPAQAAVYGFAFPSSAGAFATIRVTLTSADGTVVARADALPASAGAGSVCDAACYDAGYLSGVGTSSCCQATTCPMGCAIGAVEPSLAACHAQCANATGCEYDVPGTQLSLSMCDACLDGCPAKGECEAGCAFFYGVGAAPPAAWKALLPPQAAGGDYTLTATCGDCIAGAAPSAALEHVTFGSVFYCSGQSVRWW